MAAMTDAQIKEYLKERARFNRIRRGGPELLATGDRMHEAIEKYLEGPSTERMNELTSSIRSWRAASAKARGEEA